MEGVHECGPLGQDNVALQASPHHRWNVKLPSARKYIRIKRNKKKTINKVGHKDAEAFSTLSVTEVTLLMVLLEENDSKIFISTAQ